MAIPRKFVGLSVSDEYVEYLEDKLKSVVGIITLAERWAEDQENEIPEGNVCISAMKDIRRITKECKEYL